MSMLTPVVPSRVCLHFSTICVYCDAQVVGNRAVKCSWGRHSGKSRPPPSPSQPQPPPQQAYYAPPVQGYAALAPGPRPGACSSTHLSMYLFAVFDLFAV